MGSEFASAAVPAPIGLGSGAGCAPTERMGSGLTPSLAAMRILLVVNGSASSVTERRRVLAQKILAADHDVEVVDTNRRGHATRFAIDAARSGVDVVVAYGGDGTLNEVANGLIHTDTALGVLPGGSTNVFSRAIGLPDDPVDAALVLAASLEAGRIRRVGVGMVNDRVFLFHVGVGWDAALVKEVEAHAELKRYLGHPLFIYAGVRAFFRTYDRTRPHFRLTGSDGRVVEDGYFAVILNLNPYTFVGNRPFNLDPRATLDSPLSSICLRTMQTGPFLSLITSALGQGHRLRRAKTVAYGHDLTELRIEPFGTVPFQVDGDYLGETDGLEIRHEPASLNLVLPTLPTNPGG
jgi:diacylglycerol kinase family enzyme